MDKPNQQAATPVNLPPLAQLIAQYGLLDDATLAQAVSDAAVANIPLISHLVSSQLLTAHELAKLQSQHLKLPVYELTDAQLELVDGIGDDKLFVQHHALPLSCEANTLRLAVSDATDQRTLHAIRFHTRLMVQPVLVEEDKLAALLGTHYLGMDIALPDDEPDDTLLPTNDTPTVRFVQKLLTDAIRLRASDIHFEPYESSYRIRFRIDGVMQVVQNPPKSLAPKIASYLKVLAQLDIAERRRSQDGRLKFPSPDGSAVNFRISTLPTLYGEKIVLRLLDMNHALINLDKLGMSDVQMAQFRHAITKPQGLILITGPTGSGKTVSLYTALNLLNSPEINILSCEDPVEIYLSGINQVNINPKIQLDFADVLRAFLRQDPDVIMVGEIRDGETAKIATAAAQTGHLVLSTLHTNSAAAAITRLSSMGVPSFHLAGSLSLIIAQRLARRLCDACKQAVQIPQSVLAQAGFQPEEITQAKVLYEPAGCHKCKDGHLGRVGIFEFLPISPAIASLILTNTSEERIEAANFCQNHSLKRAGIAKVLNGEISLSEMHRVLGQT